MIKKVGTSKVVAEEVTREVPNKDEVVVDSAVDRLKMDEVTEEAVVLVVTETDALAPLSGGLPSSALMVALLS